MNSKDMTSKLTEEEKKTFDFCTKHFEKSNPQYDL